MAMGRLIGQRHLCSRGIAPTGWIRARGERALGAIGAIGATRCGVDLGSGSASNRLSCISGTANYMYYSVQSNALRLPAWLFPRSHQTATGSPGHGSQVKLYSVS